MTGLAAVILTLAGCSKDEANSQNNGGTGSLTVSLVSEFGSRASEAVDPSAAAEARVFNYTVYVFDHSTGLFEKSVDGDPNGLVTTVTGLTTAGTKRVVVVVNKCEGVPTFGPGDNYSKFATAAIDLTTQTPELMKTKGLLMSGETTSPITLVAGQANTVPVNVKRVVAKVMLRKLAFAADAVGDPTKLTVESVSVQRILSQATVGVPSVQPSGTIYYGGVAGSVSETVQPFLKDAITFASTGYTPGTELDKEFDNYFYVFPCNDPNKVTLLTIAAKYDGVASTYYYPIEINTEASPTDEQGYNADGTLIKRNYTYTVDLTIKNVVGMADPDTPADLADLTVTVVPQAWEGNIVQNSEF
jgi:hypothetical protein